MAASAPAGASMAPNRPGWGPGSLVDLRVRLRLLGFLWYLGEGGRSHFSAAGDTLCGKKNPGVTPLHFKFQKGPGLTSDRFPVCLPGVAPPTTLKPGPSE